MCPPVAVAYDYIHSCVSFPLKQQKYLVRCIKHSHLQVDCPEGYTGPVTVGYASPTIQAVNYNVIDSALLVKVTASTATQQ